MKTILIPIENIDIKKLIDLIPSKQIKEICNLSWMDDNTLWNWNTWRTKFLNKNLLKNLISTLNYRENKETWYISKRINKLKLEDFIKKV
jgi:hypothetical protein